MPSKVNSFFGGIAFSSKFVRFVALSVIFLRSVASRDADSEENWERDRKMWPRTLRLSFSQFWLHVFRVFHVGSRRFGTHEKRSLGTSLVQTC